jgi:hypothetical protein
MSPVRLDELNPETREKVLQQIGETEGVTTALAVQSTQKHSLDIMSSGSHKDREVRGRALADKFVRGLGKIVIKFIGELETEIVEVRQDFVVKPKDELICGVDTFTEYCSAVLGYSIRHIDRILEGHNPSLSEEENTTARQRKTKRELDAKTKRAQNALPIRKKTNTEILAEKIEEKNIAGLEEQVSVLTHKLQVASTKPSPVTVEEPSVKDLTKIHVSEVKALDAEITKLKGSVQTLTVAYTELRKDAVRLATIEVAQDGKYQSVTQTACWKLYDRTVQRAKTFLAKYGETVEGAL